MKQLVVLTNKIPKINNATVLTFDEELEKYKKSCKKDFLRTEACFSWYYDSLLKDLRNSVFIYPENEEVEKWIRKFYKVVEENENISYSSSVSNRH